MLNYFVEGFLLQYSYLKISFAHPALRILLVWTLEALHYLCCVFDEAVVWLLPVLARQLLFPVAYAFFPWVHRRRSGLVGQRGVKRVRLGLLLEIRAFLCLLYAVFLISSCQILRSCLVRLLIRVRATEIWCVLLTAHHLILLILLAVQILQIRDLEWAIHQCRRVGSNQRD